MSIKIDDIDLNKRTEGDSPGIVCEVRNIRRISIKGTTKLVSYRELCADKGITANLGSNSIRIYITGDLRGSESSNTIKSLYSKYKSGDPLSFNSDISSLASIDKVILEELDVFAQRAHPSSYSYYLVLINFSQRSQSSKQSAPSFDSEAKKEFEYEVERSMFES